MRTVENMVILKWDYIEQFSNDFMYFVGQTGKPYDEELSNKYLRKLPGELGKEIERKWYSLNYPQGLGVGPRIQLVYAELRERCQKVQIDNLLGKQSYKFCKTAVYTPQYYGSNKKLKRRQFNIRKTRNYPDKKETC